MQAVKTIGLDIAKSVFQVHGVDADGQAVIRRKLKRRYVLAFFSEGAIVPYRYGGLRDIASLVEGAAGAWASGAPDAAGLCQTLCQATEE
jgi:transposase